MTIKIVQTQWGGPDVLTAVEVTPPKTADLESHDVLMRVAFAGVNPVDVKTRRGEAMAATFTAFPVTLGYDVAGVVAAIGTDVSQFAVGDRVFGMIGFPRPGQAYAQYALADESELVSTPQNVSDENAAALPLAGLTAWQMLVTHGGLLAGQRILIQGAGGGTGHLAVQLAHTLGAAVTATASAGKLEWLRGLGADRVIDYSAEDLASLFAERPFDLVFNASNGTVSQGIRVTKSGGLVIDISETASDEDRALGEMTGVRVEVPHVTQDRAALVRLAELQSQNDIAVHIGAVFPLTEAARAHREVELGHATGKILLRA